ncbi:MULTISPECIES: DUF5302 domain-containing protein [Kytococcus]|uniref:DUF5302 domain-containing protein n=1 Tax=Kytococcus TaxID=57499 RepID=UPI000A77694D|nr:MULTISPECIES: DUF5302 domain-containing protein [Kytococcus]
MTNEHVTDETRRKFEEALAAKKAHGGTDVSAEGGHGKVEHPHGPETSGAQQMFRRKSV